MQRKPHCAFFPAFVSARYRSLADIPQCSAGHFGLSQSASRPKPKFLVLETEAKAHEKAHDLVPSAETMHRALLLSQHSQPDLATEVFPTQHARRNKAFFSVVSYWAGKELNSEQIDTAKRLLTVLQLAVGPKAHLTIKREKSTQEDVELL